MIKSHFLNKSRLTSRRNDKTFIRHLKLRLAICEKNALNNSKTSLKSWKHIWIRKQRFFTTTWSSNRVKEKATNDTSAQIDLKLTKRRLERCLELSIIFLAALFHAVYLFGGALFWYKTFGHAWLFFIYWRLEQWRPESESVEFGKVSVAVVFAWYVFHLLVVLFLCRLVTV